MKKKLDDIDYYFITDSRLSRKGIKDDVKNAIKGGCRIVQYREKEKSAREMIEEAGEIKKLCRDKAIFIINDQVDVALAVGADGVHLGQEDMNIGTARKLLGDKVIGITVHDLKDALEAERKGADYIAVSPVFPTDTKTDAGRSCGIEMIEMIREKVTLPLVAIGGISKQNTPEVIKAGADSVAAISAVVCSDDVEKEVREFIRIIRENKRGG